MDAGLRLAGVEFRLGFRMGGGVLGLLVLGRFGFEGLDVLGISAFGVRPA